MRHFKCLRRTFYDFIFEKFESCAFSELKVGVENFQILIKTILIFNVCNVCIVAAQGKTNKVRMQKCLSYAKCSAMENNHMVEMTADKKYTYHTPLVISSATK